MVAIASTYSTSTPVFYSPKATARPAKADFDSPTTSATPNDPTEQQQKDLDVINTLRQAKADLLKRRKKDALEKLERARKDLELLRLFRGDEKSTAWKAKEIAKQIGKAAALYGDAARATHSSAETSAPDQQTEASASDATPDAGTSAKNASSTDAPDDPSASNTEAKTPSDTSIATTVETDAEAAKLFSDAAHEVNRVFEELVRKGRIKHTSSHDWMEAERARLVMGQEVRNLSNQIELAQSVAAGIDASNTKISASLTVNVLA